MIAVLICRIFLANPLQPTDFLVGDSEPFDQEYNNYDQIQLGVNRTAIGRLIVNGTPNDPNKRLTDVSYYSDSSFNNQSSSNETSGTSTVQLKEIPPPLPPPPPSPLYVNYDQLGPIDYSNNSTGSGTPYENFRYFTDEKLANNNRPTTVPLVFNVPLDPNPMTLTKNPVIPAPKPPIPKVDKTKFSIKKANDVNFDDYLNKVMQNVIEDLKKPQPKSNFSSINQKPNPFHRSHETIANQAHKNNPRETYF